MIIDLKRTVAYICPHCSQMCAAEIDAFSIPQTGALNAMCGFHAEDNICASIKRSKDKYMINVRCPSCQGVHSYRISEKSFWKRDIITYQCPNTDTQIFYIGKTEAVEGAIDEYDEYLDDAEDGSFPDECEDNPEAKQSIMSVMMNYLHMIKRTHALICVCGSENIYIQTKNDGIVLSCRRCGRERAIEASERNLNKIMYRKPIVIG